MEYTGWFDGKRFVPYHRGYYETCNNIDGTFVVKFWTKLEWKDLLYGRPMLRSPDQNSDWRGLTESHGDDHLSLIKECVKATFPKL